MEQKEQKTEEKAKKAKHIIRLAETTLDANMPVISAIRSIRGIGFMTAHALTTTLGFRNRKLTDLSEAEQEKLEKAIMNVEKIGLPAWLYNRKKDPDTGEDLHLVASKLQLTNKTDINKLKKIKCYRGVRHSLGLPVRGQRTRSSFRKGGIVGVKRKEARRK
jgi:small subunit ribosomal protein S13